MKTVITRHVVTSKQSAQISLEKTQAEFAKKKKMKGSKKLLNPKESDTFSVKDSAKSYRNKTVGISGDALTIVAPSVSGRVSEVDILALIDKTKANKFWTVARPYFFAVRKNIDNSEKKLEDLEVITEGRKYIDNPESLDEEYNIFYVKSSDKKLLLQLPSIRSLTNLGVYSFPLLNFWTLRDENHDDPDAISPGSSRATLSVLFRIENPIIKQDVSYADMMLNNLSSNQYKNSFSAAVFLATCSDDDRHEPALLHMLLKAGANPDADAGILDNRSALANAIMQRFFPAVEELLKSGASPDYMNEDGEISGREAAKEINDDEIFRLFKKYGV